MGNTGQPQQCRVTRRILKSQWGHLTRRDCDVVMMHAVAVAQLERTRQSLLVGIERHIRTSCAAEWTTSLRSCFFGQNTSNCSTKSRNGSFHYITFFLWLSYVRVRPTPLRYQP